MKQELRNAFGKVFLTIEVDARNRWVHVNWTGYLTADNIRTGAAAYTAALQRAGFSCVLNDSREVVASWSHSLDWVLREWAPTAARAGLRHFAMVTVPDTLAGSTAADFYTNLTAFRAEVFDDMEKARDWLRSHSLGRGLR